MGVVDFDIASFEDPSPSPATTEYPSLEPQAIPAEEGIKHPESKKRPRKRKLPFRADVVVDGKKYRGKRVSRGDADLDVDVMGLRDEGEGRKGEGLMEGLIVDDEEESIEDEEADANDEVIDEDYEREKEGRESELQKGERAAAARLAEAEERERARASAVQNQKEIYDAIVDLRIRVEPLVALVKTFPIQEIRKNCQGWLGGDHVADAKTEALQKLSSVESKLEHALNMAWPCEEDSGIDFETWRDNVLDFWGRKIQIATGQEPKEGFKSFDTSVSGHMKAVVKSGKHLKKSRRVHKRLQLVGGSEMIEGTNEQQFDDGELYRVLLREIIESGEAEGGGLRYSHLSQGGKVKKKRNRLWAKGRRLRYDVHEKLVGFLAPVPLPDPGPLDEIVAAMFGKRGTVEAAD